MPNQHLEQHALRLTATVTGTDVEGLLSFSDTKTAFRSGKACCGMGFGAFSKKCAYAASSIVCPGDAAGVAQEC